MLYCLGGFLSEELNPDTVNIQLNQFPGFFFSEGDFEVIFISAGINIKAFPWGTVEPVLL